LDKIAPLHFACPFDRSGTIYANIQNPLCNFLAPWPRIINAKFHQNQTLPDRVETI